MNFGGFLSVPHLVDNYAKIVDERGRNLMCDRTLPSLLVVLQQRARTASSWLVWLVEKLVGVDADPPRPNILAKIIHIVSIFITFAYCGIFAIFLSIQLKEEKDSEFFMTSKNQSTEKFKVNELRSS